MYVYQENLWSWEATMKQKSQNNIITKQFANSTKVAVSWDMWKFHASDLHSELQNILFVLVGRWMQLNSVVLSMIPKL